MSGFLVSVVNLSHCVGEIGDGDNDRMAEVGAVARVRQIGTKTTTTRMAFRRIQICDEEGQRPPRRISRSCTCR